jgi:hypothetical protein
LLANPYVLLAIVLGLIASHGAVGYKAYHVGQDALVAQQTRDDTIEQRTRAEALRVTSEAIAQLRPKNVYRTEKIVTETVEKPVYRDCVNDDATFGLLNESLTPPERRTDTGNGGVPGANPAH